MKFSNPKDKKYLCKLFDECFNLSLRSGIIYNVCADLHHKLKIYYISIDSHASNQASQFPMVMAAA